MRTLVPLAGADLRTLACPYCGRTPTSGRGWRAVRDGRTIGVLVMAPADPGRDMAAPGASVIEQLWVAPGDVGEHVGTQLVQRACSLLVAERGRCLIAYGTPRRPDCHHLPASWLAAAGFAEHVEGVQWRIELRRTLPLAQLATDAAARLRRVLPGRPEPAPGVPRTEL